MNTPLGHRPWRAGISLLEVILAIAILGGSLAVIGELVRLGARHAEEARDLAAAQVLCEAKLEEIAAGITAAQTASSVPCETDPRWQFSITAGSLDQAGLLEVRVTIEQVESDRAQPLSFTLVRWMLDPSQTATSTSSSTTTGSGTATGTTGATNATEGGGNASRS
jgi:type II secretory pathway pseudopilin PulG